MSCRWSLRAAAPLVVLMILALAPPAWSRDDAAPPVQRAKGLLARLRDLKAAGPKEPGGSDSNLRELQECDAGLRAYLADHPSDIPAVLTLMQIYETRSVLDAVALLWTERSTIGEGREYASIVDRALLVDSLNAGLHYWRGRLYAEHDSIADERGRLHPRLSDAIREIRRAVALNPKEIRYKETLASLLLSTGDEGAARALYREVRSDHPMYLLLHDWERMPDIEGTEPLPQHGREIPALLSPVNAMIRLRLFHGTAKEFEQRCQRHWPRFRLAPDTSDAPAEWIVAQGGCLLRWKGDELVPDPSVRERPGPGAGGIWIQVLERRATDAEAKAAGYGVRAGESYCMLGFFNLRKSFRDLDER